MGEKMQAPKKQTPRLQAVTLLGEAGMGKTTLAATFPKPVFIQAEEGLLSIPSDLMPDAFDAIQNPNDLWNQLTWLVKEQHDYQTIVIDSITKLDRIFIDFILATSKLNPDLPESKALALAMGGYGAGYQALSAMHGRVRKACDILNKQRGMKVVFLAHASTETVDLPDSTPFQRFTLKMEKKSLSHYVDDVDLVGLIRLETFVLSEEKKKIGKATTDGTRIIQCNATSSAITKNRLGIHEPLTVQYGVNPFQKYL